MAQQPSGPRARAAGQLEHVARGAEGVERGDELVAAGRVLERVVVVLGGERAVVGDLLVEQLLVGHRGGRLSVRDTN